MGILDSDSEEPQSRLRRYILTGLALALLSGAGAWYLLRYRAEKETVRNFLGAVIAGDMQLAYRIWKPAPSYSFKDFSDDWGAAGYYGPVASFRIATAHRPRNGSGVIIVVAVSPVAPFPANADGTKEVRLWVERSDLSLSFPP